MSGRPPLPDRFEIRADRADDRVRLAAVGELDMVTAPQLEDAVRSELSAGPVRLELAGVTFMDSSGVRALDAITRESRAEGWDLTLDPALQDNVRQILELTGMIDVLPFAGAHDEGRA